MLDLDALSRIDDALAEISGAAPADPGRLSPLAAEMAACPIDHAADRTDGRTPSEQPRGDISKCPHFAAMAAE
ncbi:MAG: hypothetical protein AAF334_04860 [Pseudomonadota bacterium]